MYGYIYAYVGSPPPNSSAFIVFMVTVYPKKFPGTLDAMQTHPGWNASPSHGISRIRAQTHLFTSRGYSAWLVHLPACYWEEIGETQDTRKTPCIQWYELRVEPGTLSRWGILCISSNEFCLKHWMAPVMCLLSTKHCPWHKWKVRGSFLCFLFQGLRLKDLGRPVTEDEFSFFFWISGKGGGEHAETGKSKMFAEAKKRGEPPPPQNQVMHV